MFRIFIIIGALVATTSCSFLKHDILGFDKTYAEQQAGYSYIPVEPSTVSIRCISGTGFSPCKKLSKENLLDALPDNSVRFATRQVSGKVSAGISVIGADVGVEGNTYEVIIDFVNTQTVNKQFRGKWFVTVQDAASYKDIRKCYPYEKSVLEAAPAEIYENWTLIATLPPEEKIETAEVYRTNIEKSLESLNVNELKERKTAIAPRCPTLKMEEKYKYDDYQVKLEPFNVPVYFGIGLRLKANVTVLEGTVNLSSFPALTAAVKAKKATGNMSVQTIGISGSAARSGLLLLDKIDSTTIQNAIQVLASIKAGIELEDTTISPRIVGFHNTIGAGSQGVNLIHSLLASNGDNHLTINPVSFAKGAVRRSPSDKKPNK